MARPFPSCPSQCHMLLLPLFNQRPDVLFSGENPTPRSQLFEPSSHSTLTCDDCDFSVMLNLSFTSSYAPTPQPEAWGPQLILRKIPAKSCCGNRCLPTPSCLNTKRVFAPHIPCPTSSATMSVPLPVVFFPRHRLRAQPTWGPLLLCSGKRR